jgi:hypothetical protein
MPEVFTVVHRAPIILAAARNNVPAVYWLSEFVRDGGLPAAQGFINDRALREPRR